MGTTKTASARALIDPQIKKEAEAILRTFDRGPLVTDSAAPLALVYLVEHVLDTAADPREARRLLKRPLARRQIHPDLKATADNLLERLKGRPAAPAK